MWVVEECGAASKAANDDAVGARLEGGEDVSMVERRASDWLMSSCSTPGWGACKRLARRTSPVDILETHAQLAGVSSTSTS